MLRAVALFASFCIAIGCAASPEPELDEVLAASEGDLGKADGVAELRVRAGDTSLWVRNDLTVRDGETLVLRGRTSRNLVDGRGFVLDDVYGDFAVLSARTFEVTWPLSSARGLVDGVDQFVGLELVHSSTRPDSLTSHVVVRPRARNFAGTSQLYLVAELTPVVSAGTVVYRLVGTAKADMFSVDASAGDTALRSVRLVDARHFQIDIEPAVALDLIAGSAPITVRAHLVEGLVEKTAQLGASVHELGLTAGAADEIWPRECADETRTCLEGLDPGTLELAACGDAFAVNQCASEVGELVGADVVATRLAELDARLTDADGFAGDAAALVGADRVDAFTTSVRARLEETVQDTQGRWFLDAQARDTALDAVVETAFDDVYAFPLAGLEPHAPAPGDVDATRQVVADALLAYLAEQDYLHSEFSRSYVDLAHEYRAVHVESLRAFREDVAREDYPGMPELDVYVADWLGAYTEVSVDKATGAATRVYVELD
ncbi:MAG TPA: hypothetical protein VFG69_10625 [Nannocystaceae bacterium]|nr:hypothetical protein [Nannocystaceae bacterium]